MNKVFETEDALIQKIRKSQAEAIEKFSSSIFDHTTRKAIKEIY